MGTATLTNTNVYSNKASKVRWPSALAYRHFIHRPTELLTPSSVVFAGQREFLCQSNPQMMKRSIAPMEHVTRSCFFTYRVEDSSSAARPR